MKKQRWSRRTVFKYAALQLPGLTAFILALVLLRLWLLIPLWSVWILIPLWIIKDAVLFPFVWKAYDGADPAMIGSKGRAAERLDPSGHVRIQGELWMAKVAKGGPPVEKGQIVKVTAIRGLRLIVEPAEI